MILNDMNTQINAQLDAVFEALNKVILGKEHQVKLALTCLLSQGHLLIEDLPGMGKTTLSHALARVFGMAFSRIQFTSDLLPADMLGVSIFNPNSQAFTFKKGPIFNQIVLADEINRASPKTQSALLESMEEQQVSIDGTTHALPSPFFVIATQNPGFQSGTYPLPESQLDRFLMRISLGYPSFEAEKAMLKNAPVKQDELTTLFSPERLKSMQRDVEGLYASDNVIEFILRLVAASRHAKDIPNPLSPRASKAILNAAKAWAYLHNRDFVVPEDVQAVFVAVAEHRLNVSTVNQNISGSTEGNAVSQQLLRDIDPLAAA
jgi:MoxR-like ATPase